MPTTLNNLSGLLGNISDVTRQVGGIYDQYRGIRDIFEGSNVYDELGNIDITKPGASSTTVGTQFGRATTPYVQPGLEFADQLFRAGPTELNPLQTSAYNRVDPAAQQQADLAQQGAGLLSNILSGSDPYTQQLAQRGAGAANLAGAQAGTLGGYRANEAASKAAADAILSRQLDAQGRVGQAQQDITRPVDLLNRYGQQYYDWQSQEPWQHLGRYQDATGFGQSVGDQTTETITSPSGAEIYDAKLNHFLAQNQLRNSVNQGTAPSGGGSSGNPITDVGNAIGGVGDIIDTGINIWDTVSGWFNEGGEVSPSRYQKAKMRKMGGK